MNPLRPRGGVRAALRARARTLVLLAASAPLVATAAADPDADSQAPAATEEEILVLGSRTPLAPSALAGSATRFGGAELEAAQQPFVADLLRTVPTANIARTGGFGGLTQVRLRGSEANHTLVLLDGFELNDPANGSEYDFAHLRGTTIEGIELLPGPVGALWGSDAVAGAVALSTPRARRNGSEGSLRLAGGEHGTFEGTARAAHRGTRGDAMLVLDRFRTDGTNIARIGGERDGYASDTVTFGGRYEVSDQLSVHATLRHVDAEVEFDPSPFPAFLPADGDRETELQRTLLGVRGEYETESGWLHALGLERLASEYDDIADGARTGGREGERERAFLRSTLDYSAGLPGAQRLTLLGEIEREEFEQDGTTTAFGDPNQDQDLEHRSLLVEWRWQTDGGAHLAAAVRRDWNDAFDDATQYRFAARTPLPADLGDAWASWASATKNPGFIERFGFTPDTFQGNADLRPEQSRAFELGWTRTFADGVFDAEVVWHRTRLEDEINGFVFDAGTGFFTAANNGRSSHRDGIETRVTIRPDPGTSVTFRHAWLDADEPDATGRTREIRRARHAAGVNLLHEVAEWPVTLRADLAYVGTRDDRDFATFPATTMKLDDFVTLGVAMTWQVRPGFDLFVRGDGLLTQDYEDVFGYASPGQALRAGFEYRTR